MIRLQVRHWTDNKDIPTPWDVVAIDTASNRQHYQPGAEFSTEALAISHMAKLQKRIDSDSSTVEFIRKNWPCDGSGQ